jgi:hypothetical protein
VAGDIGAVYLDVLPNLDDFGGALSEGVLQDAEAAGQAAGDAVGNALTESIQGAVAGVDLDMSSAGQVAGEGLGEAAANAAGDAIHGSLPPLVDEAATAAGEMAGVNMGEAIADGVENATSDIGDRLTEGMSEAGAEGGTAAATGIEAAAVGGFAGFTGKAGNMGALAGGAFATYFGISAIKGVEEDMKQLGRIQFGLEQLGITGAEAAKPLTDFATDFAEKSGIVDETIMKLEASLLTLGRGFLEQLGPDAALKTVQDLSAGLIQLALATGKPLQMMMRSLGPSILNTPEKAVAILQKFGALTPDLTQKVKDFAAAGNRQAATQLIINTLMEKYSGIAEKAVTPSEKLHVVFDEISDAVGMAFYPALNAVSNLLLKIPTPITAIIVGIGALTAAMIVSVKLWAIFGGAVTSVGRTLIGIPMLIAKVRVALLALSASAGVGGAAGAVALFAAAIPALTIGLLAATPALVDWYDKLTAANRTLQELVAERHLEGLVDQIGKMNVVTDEQAAHLGFTVDALRQADMAREDFGKGSDMDRIFTERYNDSLAALNDYLHANGIEATLTTEDIYHLGEGHRVAGLQADELTKSEDRLGKGLDSINELFGTNIDTTKGFIAAQDEAQQAAEDFASSTSDSINFVVQDLQTLSSQAQITANGIHRSLQEQAKDMRDFGKDLNKIARDGTKGSAELVQQLIAMGPAGAHMADVIAGATPKVRASIERDIGGSLKAADSLSNKLTHTLIEGMNNIAAAIIFASGKVDTLQEALAQVNGMHVKATVDISEIITQSRHFASNKNRQHGGPVYPGGVYTVGEVGPETFVPNAAGTIVPHGGGKPSGPMTMRIIDWKRGLVELAGELEWIGRG